jgi:hypothetical protein
MKGRSASIGAYCVYAPILDFREILDGLFCPMEKILFHGALGTQQNGIQSQGVALRLNIMLIVYQRRSRRKCSLIRILIARELHEIHLYPFKK